jgi:hypothetical protein
MIFSLILIFRNYYDNVTLTSRVRPTAEKSGWTPDGAPGSATHALNGP